MNTPRPLPPTDFPHPGTSLPHPAFAAQAATTIRTSPAVTGASLVALGRLAARTRRLRRRLDDAVLHGRRRLDDALAVLAARRADVDRARGDEDRARGEVTDASAHDAEASRRGLSTGWYTAILALLWAVNVPVAIATFQIFEEPLSLTIPLALLADTVILCSAHASAVTFHRAHHLPDGRVLLGLELRVAWVLVTLGIAAAFAQAWARWQYLQLTGVGSSVAIAVTTVLMLATFLIALWAAWRHHNPLVGALTGAQRRTRRAERGAQQAARSVNRRQTQLLSAEAGRRRLAQTVSARADRILLHFHLHSATSNSPSDTSPIDWAAASPAAVGEPDWLLLERTLGQPDQAIASRAESTAALTSAGGGTGVVVEPAD